MGTLFQCNAFAMSECSLPRMPCAAGIRHFYLCGSLHGADHGAGNFQRTRPVAGAGQTWIGTGAHSHGFDHGQLGVRVLGVSLGCTGLLLLLLSRWSGPFWWTILFFVWMVWAFLVNQKFGDSFWAIHSKSAEVRCVA